MPFSFQNSLQIFFFRIAIRFNIKFLIPFTILTFGERKKKNWKVARFVMLKEGLTDLDDAILHIQHNKNNKIIHTLNVKTRILKMTDYFPGLLISCCLFPCISSRTPPIFSSALFVVGLLERRSLSPDFQLSEVSAHRIILQKFLNHSNIFHKRMNVMITYNINSSMAVHACAVRSLLGG